MIIIQYPDPDFKIKEEGERKIIFDPLRKKWIVLTPEEWVRQNFVQYLIQKKSYPASLIALEKEIQLGDLKKRFDLLVYDSAFKPRILVECKAMEVKLTEKVLEQILRYNVALPVPFLVITNGKSCFGFKKEGGTIIPVSEIPEFEK